MSTPTSDRQPAGTPVGGQFAATARTETGTELTDVQRENIADRIVGELHYAHAVSADSQQIGYHLNDIDEIAAIAAWTALELGERETAEDRHIAAARTALTDRLVPDEMAKSWTGQDMYWTDELEDVAATMTDAVLAERDHPQERAA